mmetsp:Transcript_594/g.1380  ORF Transcript_594/g.1380 Transcript_594/m.1380 type:complete len:959 (+) Transcript_594:359-3235(+)
MNGSSNNFMLLFPCMIIVTFPSFVIQKNSPESMPILSFLKATHSIHGASIPSPLYAIPTESNGTRIDGVRERCCFRSFVRSVGLGQDEFSNGDTVLGRLVAPEMQRVLALLQHQGNGIGLPPLSEGIREFQDAAAGVVVEANRGHLDPLPNVDRADNGLQQIRARFRNVVDLVPELGLHPLAGSGGILHDTALGVGALGVVFFLVGVRDTFQDVPIHVVDPKGVWFLQANGIGLLGLGIARVPGILAQKGSVVVAVLFGKEPHPVGRGGTGVSACGVFPLGLRRQPHVKAGGIVHRVAKGPGRALADVADGALRFVCGGGVLAGHGLELFLCHGVLAHVKSIGDFYGVVRDLDAVEAVLVFSRPSHDECSGGNVHEFDRHRIIVVLGQGQCDGGFRAGAPEVFVVDRHGGPEPPVAVLAFASGEEPPPVVVDPQYCGSLLLEGGQINLLVAGIATGGRGRSTCGNFAVVLVAGNNNSLHDGNVLGSSRIRIGRGRDAKGWPPAVALRNKHGLSRQGGRLHRRLGDRHQGIVCGTRSPLRRGVPGSHGVVPTKDRFLDPQREAVPQTDRARLLQVQKDALAPSQLFRVVDPVDPLFVEQLTDPLGQLDPRVVLCVRPRPGRGQEIEVLDISCFRPPRPEVPPEVDHPVAVGWHPVGQRGVSLRRPCRRGNPKGPEDEPPEKGPPAADPPVQKNVLVLVVLRVVLVDPLGSVGDVCPNNRRVEPVRIVVEGVVGIEPQQGPATPLRDLVGFVPVDHEPQLPGGEGRKGGIELSLQVGNLVIEIAADGIDGVFDGIGFGRTRVRLHHRSGVDEGDRDRQPVQDRMVFRVLDGVAFGVDVPVDFHGPAVVPTGSSVGQQHFFQETGHRSVFVLQVQEFVHRGLGKDDAGIRVLLFSLQEFLEGDETQQLSFPGFLVRKGVGIEKPEGLVQHSIGVLLLRVAAAVVAAVVAAVAVAGQPRRHR